LIKKPLLVIDAGFWIDSLKCFPKSFVNKGELAFEVRGNFKPWFWSELFYIFIPEGKEKTLAEMSRRGMF
jgi:inosine/xanthosine triphosphate pyrophosphatase family protein